MFFTSEMKSLFVVRYRKCKNKKKHIKDLQYKSKHISTTYSINTPKVIYIKPSERSLTKMPSHFSENGLNSRERHHNIHLNPSSWASNRFNARDQSWTGFFCCDVNSHLNNSQNDRNELLECSFNVHEFSPGYSGRQIQWGAGVETVSANYSSDW